ncbi:hypothetical protein DMB66_10500 [Actinoplanes sp. ATCC 53533]|nr:hypothetical protein DMB66_10500 [Actinoplanes sp. ATCC 53533]
MPVILTSTLALAGTRALAAGDSPVPPSTMTVSERVAASPDRILTDADALVEKLNKLESQVERDTSPTAARLVAQVREEVIDGRIPVHLPSGSGVAGADPVVWRDASGARAVHLPYTGTAARPSGLTVMFDAEGNRTGTSEQVYQVPSANSATVAAWVNGVLRGSVLVDASGAVTPSAKAPATTDARALQSTFYERLNNCLSAAGIPSAIITAIGIACSFICVGTVGLGCFACLGAAAGGFAAIVEFCIEVSL